MALDKKKVKKDLEALDDDDRGLVRDALNELDGLGEGLTGEEVTEIRDLLKKAKQGGKGKGGGVLSFLRGE